MITEGCYVIIKRIIFPILKQVGGGSNRVLTIPTTMNIQVWLSLISMLSYRMSQPLIWWHVALKTMMFAFFLTCAWDNSISSSHELLTSQTLDQHRFFFICIVRRISAFHTIMTFHLPFWERKKLLYTSLPLIHPT